MGREKYDSHGEYVFIPAGRTVYDLKRYNNIYGMSFRCPQLCQKRFGHSQEHVGSG